MKTLFSAYYSPTDEQFQNIWRDGLFVVDTNVLLGLYRYPKQAQEDLLRALQALANRLWIPHQVALEFQENRNDVFYEQLARYDQVKNAMDQARSDIRKKLDGMQLKERHSIINPDQFLQKIDQTVDAFRRELDDLQKQHEVRGEDTTRKAIDTLLEGRVGNPLSQDELDALYKDGAKRYELRRPPGYLDKPKGKEKTPCYFYGDLTIKREYGDLVIWEQVIREAKLRNVKYVVIVTEDRSEDWWWIQNGKTLGPRPELATEIAKKTSVSIFHMYRVDRFLEYSRQYLGAEVKEDSVAQVRDVALVDESSPPRIEHALQRAKIATMAVYRWLVSTHGQHMVRLDESFPEIIVRRGSERVAYDIKAPSHQVSLSKLKEWLKTAESRLQEQSLRHCRTFVYVIAFANTSDARLFLNMIARIEFIPPKIVVVTGYLEVADGDGYIFVPLDQSDAPHDYTWLCGNCRSFGPWDGARCLTCGQMSHD